MTFVSIALAMLALLFGVGAPVAMLVLPRQRRMHWPVVAPVAGGALIATIVWCAVWADLRVSILLVRYSLLVPLTLAALVVVRDRRRVVKLVATGGRKHALPMLISIVVTWTVAQPLVQARLGLTSISLGSCDAADYAGGATLMRDHVRSDLSGFNGQTEVVALRSVATFHEHWLRLNHFAPAALIAWFSSLFELPVFKLVTALAVALHAAAIPAVFWLARAGLRLAPEGALAAAACWGCSAPAVYGVAQTALGQIMAVPAVALLTWVGLRAFYEGAQWRGALRWLPLASTAFVVILGAYSFALVFVLGPLAVSLLWLAWRAHDAMRLVRSLACGTSALAIAGVLYWDRIVGLWDRFALFEAIDFGWFIPVFTPERWLGWFGDAALASGSAYLGWTIVAVVVATSIAHVVRAWPRDQKRIGVAVAWVLTVVAGYSVLAMEGLREGSNEVYNAYKVFAVLQPLVVAAVLMPVVQRHGRDRALGALLAAGLVVVHWFGASPVRSALRQPSLWVDKPLAGLADIGQRTDITSVNMRLEPMWTRLWANSMLLSKHQYFRTATYEGRRATELRGDWDLCDGLLAVDTADADTIQCGSGYHLVRRRSPRYVGIELASGWHPIEGGGSGHWVWSSGEAVLAFSNPHAHAVRVRLSFGFQGNGSRQVLIHADGNGPPLWSGELGGDMTSGEIDALMLKPGATTLRIQSTTPAFAPPGDGRLLAFALHKMHATVVPEEMGP